MSKFATGDRSSVKDFVPALLDEIGEFRVSKPGVVGRFIANEGVLRSIAAQPEDRITNSGSADMWLVEKLSDRTSIDHSHSKGA